MTRRDAILQRRDELLTVDEYASLARVCAMTVYRRIWRGVQVGAVRMGGQWRIDVSATLRPSSGNPQQIPPV